MRVDVNLYSSGRKDSLITVDGIRSSLTVGDVPRSTLGCIPIVMLNDPFVIQLKPVIKLVLFPHLPLLCLVSLRGGHVQDVEVQTTEHHSVATSLPYTALQTQSLAIQIPLLSGDHILKVELHREQSLWNMGLMPIKSADYYIYKPSKVSMSSSEESVTELSLLVCSGFPMTNLGKSPSMR